MPIWTPIGGTDAKTHTTFVMMLQHVHIQQGSRTGVSQTFLPWMHGIVI